MTLTQLEYLVAVETHRSFVTAAEKCFVTQPTLSMQIGKLEEELGVKLFDRSKQPVIPTEIGLSVIAQARIALAESAKIPHIIKDQTGKIEGPLHVGIIPTLAPYLLPAFLGEFLKNHPAINLTIQELTTDEIIHRLKQGLLDCAILATPLEHGGLFEQPLFYEPFVAYVSKKSPLFGKTTINASDIIPEETWILQEGHCFRNQVLNLCRAVGKASEKNLFYESGSIETLKKLVDLNGGVTILPQLAIKEFGIREMGMVRYFSSDEPVREISLVTRRNFIKKRLIEVLGKAIKEAVPPKMREKGKTSILKV